MVAGRLGDRITPAAKSEETHHESTGTVSDLELRLGGIALSNGLVVVSAKHWAVAVREDDGSISVASGKKPLMPGTGEREAIADLTGRGCRSCKGVPVVRGLGRLAESLMVLGYVKKHLPGARLPFESRRVAAALLASTIGAAAVRVIAPRSALAQEAGSALAALVPAVLAIKNSPVSGYHGAEHKVIGARETAIRAVASEYGGRTTADGGEGDLVDLTGDASVAPKEHDRCGSNLVGPFLLASVFANLLARDRQGRKSPLRSAIAGAMSLGVALEALGWASRHVDSLAARLMMMPGRALQKGLTTTEPTTAQLEVGERALAELLRLEGARD